MFAELFLNVSVMITNENQIAVTLFSAAQKTIENVVMQNALPDV